MSGIGPGEIERTLASMGGETQAAKDRVEAQRRAYERWKAERDRTSVGYSIRFDPTGDASKSKTSKSL